MIRAAQITDIGTVCQLTQEFIEEYVVHSPVYTDHSHVFDHIQNRRRLTVLVQDWLRNHYVIIAYDQQGQAQGLLAAVREQNYWDPKITVLREIAWYMRPEHRRSRLSAELFLRWQTDVSEFIARGQISKASISLPEGHESVNLDRRGWQRLEQHWIKG